MVQGTIAGTQLAILPLGCYCNYGPTDVLVFAARGGKVVFIKRFHGQQLNAIIVDNVFYTVTVYPRANESHAAQTGATITQYAFRDPTFRHLNAVVTTTKSAAYQHLTGSATKQDRHVFVARSEWMKWFAP